MNMNRIVLPLALLLLILGLATIPNQASRRWRDASDATAVESPAEEFSP